MSNSAHPSWCASQPHCADDGAHISRGHRISPGPTDVAMQVFLEQSTAPGAAAQIVLRIADDTADDHYLALGQATALSFTLRGLLRRAGVL